jgi:hypothetical protein
MKSPEQTMRKALQQSVRTALLLGAAYTYCAVVYESRKNREATKTDHSSTMNPSPVAQNRILTIRLQLAVVTRGSIGRIGMRPAMS